MGGQVQSKHMSDFDCTVAEPPLDLAASKVIDASAKRAWRKIGIEDDFELYIDDGSASRVSYLVSAWLKRVYKTAQPSPYSAADHVVEIVGGTYNCKDQIYSEGRSTRYDAQGNGIALPPSPPRRAARLPPGGSIASDFEAFCQSPRSRGSLVNCISGPGTADPRAITVFAPTYPSAERELGIAGTTAIDVQIDVRGNILNVEIYSSSGNSNLDKAALEAVRKWTFASGTCGGTPVGGVVRVPIVFTGP